MIGRKISLYKTKLMVSVRDFGLKHTLQRIIEDALLGRIFLFRRYIIYEKDLSNLNGVKLRNANLKFTFISPQDSKIIEQIEELSGMSRELVYRKIANGGECIVASDNGKLAGFNLVSVGRAHIRYIDGYLDLPGSEAWSEQITVSPEYRQCGLASDMRHLMFARLAQKGFTKLIGGYVPFNVKSGLLAKKLGFVERERVTLIKVLKWKNFYTQALAPHILPRLKISRK